MRSLSPMLLSLVLIAGCSDDTTVCPPPPDQRAPYDGGLADSAADLARVDTGLDGPAATDQSGTDAPGGDASGPDAAASKETDCSDGKDNDGDKVADCLDPDCDKQLCRVTVGYCDAEEVCQNKACPADGFKTKGAVCRKGGSCDLEEKCDGTSKHCPTDKLAGTNLVCRAPTGPCDHAEMCDGVSPGCPTDVLEIKGEVCRGGIGPCDKAEECDGTSDTCPADKLVPVADKKVCRAAAGLCDAAELCDGKAATCPKDALLGPGAPVCRASGGACDFAETCDGKGALCPADVNGCKTNEYCSSGACLPTKAQGTACGAGAECGSGFCADKVCCDKACSGTCRSCVVAGSVGTCKNHAAGTDPEKGCVKYTCDGKGACFDYCIDKTGKGHCNPLFYCAYGECRFKYPNGSTCQTISEYMCQSGFCWRAKWKNTGSWGTCCDKGCSECCSDCASGKCTSRPAGTDASNCSSSYVCDGAGGHKTTCTADALNCSADCNANAWCWNSKCEYDLLSGAACVGACQCKSNVCFPFVCW
jgi:hypothetical protein